MAKATSRYRQVRITVTEEFGGRLSARVMVKPLQGEWTMRHTVWVHSWKADGPTSHWADLVSMALLEITEQPTLTDD